MSLLALVGVLLIAGVAMAVIPMDAGVRRLILIVLGVAVVLFLVGLLFGAVPSLKWR